MTDMTKLRTAYCVSGTRWILQFLSDDQKILFAHFLSCTLVRNCKPRMIDSALLLDTSFDLSEGRLSLYLNLRDSFDGIN